MRAGIVDNSTLTACQRLLGDVGIANLHNIDGDIAAMESLLQGILFCDDLYFLDDYKEEYQQSRKKRFPFLTPITLTERKHKELIDFSTNATSNMLVRIEAGQVSTKELAKFFDEINSHFIFAWHMQSSDFLLNVKLLGGPNFDKDLIASIARRMVARVAFTFAVYMLEELLSSKSSSS